MRIDLKLTPNKQVVPYTYPHHLTGAFHALMGWNEVHDGLSCYSISWLKGEKSRSTRDGLLFPNGAEWSISTYDEKMAAKLRESAEELPEIAFGMRIYRVTERPTPAFGSVYRFEVGSPVLVRGMEEDGRRPHLLYSDPEADTFLTQTLRSKLEAAGFSGSHLDVLVGFDRSYQRARTKLVDVKGTKFRCSVCPVIVAGTPQAVRFAWNVGAGHLTGSGFGFLKAS